MSGEIPDWVKHTGIGFLAGLAVAIGGAIKDAPYEGFDATKFIRSPIIGAVEAPLMGKAFPKPNPYLLFFSTIGTERITVESYKLIRAKMALYYPDKFRLGEWGVPVPAKLLVVSR